MAIDAMMHHKRPLRCREGRREMVPGISVALVRHRRENPAAETPQVFPGGIAGTKAVHVHRGDATTHEVGPEGRVGGV